MLYGLQSPRVSFSFISSHYSPVPSTPAPLVPTSRSDRLEEMNVCKLASMASRGRVQDHVGSAFFELATLSSLGQLISLCLQYWISIWTRPVSAYCRLQSLGFVFILDRAEWLLVVQINGVLCERMHCELLVSYAATVCTCAPQTVLFYLL